MTTNTFRDAIVALRAEREDVAADVKRLRAEMTAAETRLGYLDGAIENLVQLGGDAADDADETPDVTDIEVEDDAETDDDLPDDGLSPFEQPHTVIRRKTPSTAMVADLVNEVGRPMHRDEVVDAYEARHGFPPSWQNPRNTLGNALLRAWSRGLIVRVDQDHFAPRRYAGKSSTEAADA